jgi:hypothetical protein
MPVESYRLKMNKKLLAFVVANDAARQEALGAVLRELGAQVVGPLVYGLENDRFIPEQVKQALGDLLEGECVYFLEASDGGLDVVMLVPPKMGGRLVVT